ncbi:MAG: V-type ATP synthase subunit A [Gammaproteobacteria bacterium]|nr:V-type ATP synthase subunit A [Gammaproteobacteria bacterium]
MPGKLTYINGPLVKAILANASIGEQVQLGQLKLMGEVIGREDNTALIQVYEDTQSLKPGEQVIALGHPLSVELGPGLLGKIFDGVQRPLQQILKQAGDEIPRGLDIPALDQNQQWPFIPNSSLKIGDKILPGQIIGEVKETLSITHKILIPPDKIPLNSKGELVEIADAGNYTLKDPIARIKIIGAGQNKEQDIYLSHHWPVRKARPFLRRDQSSEPLITGQRIFDTFFPLLKGGKAAIPGPFGAGKTMVQQQIARWSNADIVIYVGCGERGNELVDVLESFPEMIDPKNKHSLMERTILVANTSNMPVVAREASIYVGVTIAEYYRDQGLDVVMVADSTSRWAEALREVAGRLGQMPVEEGYPAYLASHLAAFYERSGRVHILAEQALEDKAFDNKDSELKGSVTLIGAVSPPGGDFSEPVTGHTKDIVQTFWALSKELADARHYPSVSWTDSFSGYVDETAKWWAAEINPNWKAYRALCLSLLSQSQELMRIVNLVGAEALSGKQRWILLMAELIREGLLQQSALDDVDSYASPEKQFLLLQMMILIYQQGLGLIELGMPIQKINSLPMIMQAKRSKSIYSSEQLTDLKAFIEHLENEFKQLHEEYS